MHDRIATGNGLTQRLWFSQIANNRLACNAFQIAGTARLAHQQP